MATKLADAEGGEVDEYLESWGRRLRARNRSEKTIRGYGETVQLFLQFLRRHDMPTAVGEVKREHVEAFIADQLARWKPTTALTRHQALRQFFLYLVDEGELTDSPMARMKPPSIPDVPVPIVTDNDLRRLLKACEGTDFESRRDMAILRLFIDTGCRLAEITDLAVEDVILEAEVINVVGKGKRPRSAPYGPKTSSALDRYLRLRKRHPQSHCPALWLGPKGGLTSSGVAQILRRRCAAAGIPQLHPHQFRHTAAHAWLASGGGETDAMRLFGWKSRVMLNRYGASNADERARDSYRRILPGDRI